MHVDDGGGIAAIATSASGEKECGYRKGDAKRLSCPSRGFVRYRRNARVGAGKISRRDFSPPVRLRLINGDDARINLVAIMGSSSGQSRRINVSHRRKVKNNARVLPYTVKACRVEERG